MFITDHLANALTFLRILLAPIASFCLWQGGSSPLPGSALESRPEWTLAAFFLILAAALTDWLDGLAARAFQSQSRLGRLLDPLADKILCWLLLLSFSALSAWNLAIVLPGLLILVRDIAVTARRFTAGDGEGPPPSRLAKLKTALEMTVLTAGPLLALAGAPIFLSLLWLSGLFLCTVLSIWVGFFYLVKV